MSRLLAPIDSPLLAELMAARDEVNAEADAAPGFRWRLQTEDGNATAGGAFGWGAGDTHGAVVNLTTWASVRALGDFTLSGRHLQVMRRRRQWFQRAVEPMTALWWVPAGHRPGTDDAEARVRHLHRHGSTPEAFTFAAPFTSPDGGASVPGSDDWLCPA